MVGSVAVVHSSLSRASAKETRDSSNQDMCQPWWLPSEHLPVLKLNTHTAICEPESAVVYTVLHRAPYRLAN
jgi:hypothetical protein